MGESPEVQGALMLQANEALKRLGGRWMLQSEAQRQRVTRSRGRLAVPGADPARSGTPPAAAGGTRQSRNRYFLTLSWWPPTVGRGVGCGSWFSGAARGGAAGGPGGRGHVT